MALIKAEYLAQYRNKYGVSLRSYLLAHMPRWLFYAPWLRHLIRLRNRFSAVAWLTEKLVGFTAGVPLPVPVARRYRGNSSAASEDADFEVILLVDTFSRYFEPEVPTAAVALLTDFGYRVAELELPPGERPLCCGRTYLAQGMVAEARTEAERLLEALLPYCREGKTVIGLEASCVLHLRDDIHALGLADKAMPVLERLLLLEEFLAREIKAGRVCSAFAEVDGKTLVHGHCQQKAAGAMKSVRRVLKEIPAHDFDMIESSCCGMAGSFGLESEHHHLSEAMAENSLLPALREQEHHHLIVNGFSCRHQIRSSSDEYPEHLAVFLRDRQKAKTVVAD